MKEPISFETWLEDYTDALLQFTIQYRQLMKESPAYPESATGEFFDAAFELFCKEESI